MSGLFDTMRQKGEERLGALTSDWLGNERFMAAVEAALSTKGFLERQLKKVLHTMSVASRLDIDELNSKLGESERKVPDLLQVLRPAVGLPNAVFFLPNSRLALAIPLCIRDQQFRECVADHGYALPPR